MHLIGLILAAVMPAQTLTPEFTVLYSEKNPGYYRNFTHPDFRTAPRSAIRWRPSDTLDPFAAAEQSTAIRARQFDSSDFTLSAELTNDAEPALMWHLTAKRPGYFSVAFTGAPEISADKLIPVPQECLDRAGRCNYVLAECDLKLPRIQFATGQSNFALVVDPRESPFRLPDAQNSRFGLMVQKKNGKFKPVVFAPLLGGAESQMNAGDTRSFSVHYVTRPGDWKETYRHIAQNIYGFRDQRDNSGPGPLNGTLERIMDFLANRNGQNHALWHAEQKYYDYWTDKSGIFKPFSPLFGLSAAIVTDDEDFFRQRARPAVEFALSRKYNVFAPYDNADNKQARSAQRDLGAPYISREQLLSLDDFFQHRSPVLTALAQEKEPARRATDGEAALFDALERNDLHAAVDAAYRLVTTLNLFPAVPDTNVTVDVGGIGPVHPHSFGRHRNIWGFPPPQPVPVPEQTVPAWRVARLGLPSPAYPMEYWMNIHAALLRVAALANDDFLRDVAHWGMVGRFGNYPGDNRSKVSLVAELPDAVEHPPWDWNFATVNPGHAWEFAGAVLDFLVTDAFDRSHGTIDFPASSLAGSNFRVRTYGAKPGRFAGEDNVHLWLPRGLVTCDNRQFNWLTGYGNGKFYLALLNQSFRDEHATVTLNRDLVECVSNRLAVVVAPKGIVTFALPATVKSRLQAKLYDAATPALGSGSFTNIGKVHAMLLRAGRGLTSAFVYTEALPEDVIVAKLRWRQGSGAWQEMTDDIYPYEYSPQLRDGAGDFECILEIENARQSVQQSSRILLKETLP